MLVCEQLLGAVEVEARLEPGCDECLELARHQGNTVLPGEIERSCPEQVDNQGQLVRIGIPDRRGKLARQSPKPDPVTKIRLEDLSRSVVAGHEAVADDDLTIDRGHRARGISGDAAPVAAEGECRTLRAADGQCLPRAAQQRPGPAPHGVLGVVADRHDDPSHDLRVVLCHQEARRSERVASRPAGYGSITSRRPAADRARSGTPR